MPHSFENYDDKSSTYTAMRLPIGAERIVDFISGGNISNINITAPNESDHNHNENLENIINNNINSQLNQSVQTTSTTKSLSHNTALSNIKLFDSGCGTGNYTVAFLQKYGLKSCHCSDYNQAMLDKAKMNIDEALNDVNYNLNDFNLTYSVDNVCDMKNIPSNTYDAVINNQVIHHLRPDNNFSDLKNACKEWYRILKCNNTGSTSSSKSGSAKISINFSPPLSQRLSMWWAELIPKAQSKWECLSPTI